MLEPLRLHGPRPRLRRVQLEEANRGQKVEIVEYVEPLRPMGSLPASVWEV